jgi:glycosyltransferase involved in cell wall biosynthesis
MSEPEAPVYLSIIIPVGVRFSEAEDLYRDYKSGLTALGVTYEFIFVLDGPRKEFARGLDRLAAAGEEFTIVNLTRSFGEATALMAGFEQARGDCIVTLPAYFQIEHSEIALLVGGLDGADMVIGRRHPRAGSAFEAFRRRLFHRMLGWVTHLQFHDLGCGARALKRHVLEEIQLYGDQHRFLPVLADRQGFRVNEVEVRQSLHDRFDKGYRVSEYARGFLDIFTVFFLVRFTKKPLRFFGMLGVSVFGIGALLITYMVAQRLFLDQALASRPALLLASLMVVLGLQLFAIGLLGELIIFTHAKQLKEYQVERLIQFPETPASPDRSSADYSA